jgi:hypothetical protein
MTLVVGESFLGGKMAYREAKSSGRKRKRKLEHTEVRNSENGGHTVEHHFDNSGDFSSFQKPVTYSFSSGPEMVKHIMDTHGVPDNDMIAHLHGDNEAEPGGGEAEAGNRGGGDTDSLDDEEEGN